MKFPYPTRGLTSVFQGGGSGGMGAAAMVYSDDTPALIKALAWASKAIYGARVQICNGVADEVEINAALAAIAAVGGTVLLSEGTFHIANPVIVPGNNIMLRGLGLGTIIDGDLLATGEHGIVVSAMAGVWLRDFAIQTEDGGGKVCHCIFVEDGADRFKVSHVDVLASDSDGVHVEGTTITGGDVRNCRFRSVDGRGIYAGIDAGEVLNWLRVTGCDFSLCGSHGIMFDTGSDGYYTCVIESNIMNAVLGDCIHLFDAHGCEIVGNVLVDNAVDGIRVQDGATNLLIRGNYCYSCGADGIRLVANNDNCILDGNRCRDNTANGINNVAATSDKCIITSNQLLGNGGANLIDAGTETMTAHNITV